jgi:hypothetical protein
MHMIAWKTSSYSGSSGANCVEVGWKTSSYSGSSDGNCVEVGSASTAVAVRDSKHRDGGMLRFSTADWTAFLRTL